MNYILLHSTYGKESMTMTVDQMTEECALLIKNKSGDWRHYSPESKQTTHLHGIREFLGGKNSVINWGNYIFSNDGYFRLNVPSAVARTSNKSGARSYLQDCGIAVPRTWFNGEFPEFPCIARPPYHHGGKEFYVLQNEKDLRDLDGKISMLGWYLSEIFDKTHEYRVHCGHGKILLINEKPLVEGELRANMAVNHESWRVLKWGEFPTVVCQESLRAVEALGLDYGAVDIMYNADTNEAAICEVNTSPSINTPYTSGKYAEYFSWVIRHGFPEHFEIDGTSVFYNKILRS